MTFKRSLAQGELGETLFMLAHEGTGLKRIDGFKGDFQMADGRKGELKTDSYPMSTGNFFIERYSSESKQSPGGPWQAKEHGCDVFFYFYPRDLTYFTFDVNKLVGALEEIIPTLEPVRIENKSWTTIGYKVPRAAVEHLATVKRIKLRVEE